MYVLISECQVLAAHLNHESLQCIERLHTCYLRQHLDTILFWAEMLTPLGTQSAAHAQ